MTTIESSFEGAETKTLEGIALACMGGDFVSDFPDMLPEFTESVKPDPPSLAELQTILSRDDAFEIEGREWAQQKAFDGVDSVVNQRTAVAWDWYSHANKNILLASWAFYALSKAAGRSKANDLAVGVATVETQQQTGSPVAAVAATIAIGTVLSRVNAGAMNMAIDNSPHTTESSKRNFAAYSRLQVDTTPELNYYTDAELAKTNQLPARQRASRFLSSHYRRGLVAMNKITSFMTIAGKEGHSVSERRKLANAACIDGAVMKGGILAAGAAAVYGVGHVNQAAAENLSDVVWNPISIAAIGTMVMANEFSKNNLHKFKDWRAVRSESK